MSTTMCAFAGTHYFLIKLAVLPAGALILGLLWARGKISTAIFWKFETSCLVFLYPSLCMATLSMFRCYTTAGREGTRASCFENGVISPIL